MSNIEFGKTRYIEENIVRTKNTWQKVLANLDQN